MKLKIDQEQFDGLHESLREQYVEGDKGVYQLDIEDMPSSEPQRDDGPLKRAHERAKQERREALDKLAEYETKAANDTKDNLRKKGDLETLEKSWAADKETMKGDMQAIIDKQQSFMKKQLVDNQAMKLANEISDTPEVMLPHIKSRLKADFDTESPSTRYLDQNGDISSMTYDDLKKEFMDNPIFSSNIRANKSSGSGAVGSKGSNSGDAATKNIFKMNAQEIGAWERSGDPAFKKAYDKRFNS